MCKLLKNLLLFFLISCNSASKHKKERGWGGACADVDNTCQEVLKTTIVAEIINLNNEGKAVDLRSNDRQNYSFLFSFCTKLYVHKLQ